MKKQIISIAAAVAMFAAAIPGALAAKTYPSGSQWVFSSVDGKGTYEISTAEAYSGDSSLYIDAQGSKGAKLFMNTSQAGGYKISFYLKEVSPGEHSGMRVVASNEGAPLERLFSGSNWKKTPVGNGWVKYEGDYWNTQSGNGLMIFNDGFGKYYIDDLKVTHDWDSTKTIIDDFEKTTVTKNDVPWWTDKVDGGSFSEVVEENGNHCWKLTGPGQVMRKVKLPVPTSAMGRNFTYELKAKITAGEPSAFYFGFNNENQFNILNWEKTDLSDGWASYKATLKRWHGGNFDFRLWMPYGSSGVEILVDDLSIAVDGDTLVYEDCEPSVHYEYTEELASLSANGNSNNIVLTWNNPNRSDITGFKVYEGNTEIDTSAITFSTAAYKLNTVTITPGDDNVHTYRVDMTAGGKTYSTTISGKRSNGTGNMNVVSYLNSGSTKDGYSLEGAYIECWKGGDEWAQLPYGSVALDTKNKYSGNSSLRINPNYPNVCWDSGMWLWVFVPGIQNGKTYKLTYMEKYDRAKTSSGWVDNLIGWKYMTNNSGARVFVKNTDGTYSTKWNKRELTFAGESGSNLCFRFICNAQNVWLDDIEVYEVDAEGNTTGSNLVVNGGFEYKLDNLAFDGSTLTWSVPDGANYDRIDIVTTTNGLTETYSVNPTNGAYTLQAFNGSEQTIDVYGVRVGGTEYKTKFGSYARENDFYIAPASFDTVTKNADDTYTTVEEGISNTRAGLVRSNVTIKNNKLETLSCDVYTAVYNSEGVLVKVDKMTSEIAKGSQATVGSVIDVPGDNYIMKTFVWDAGTVTPKANASELPAASAN